jgi:6-pyruvoyltetrahydropterin/6-carboxytetrahydropterin synthase
MFTVTKEYSFDAAHRLVRGYEGKCAHVHGHTWRARLSAEASSLNRVGMVRDFGDFKPIKDWIDEKLDHATIISDEDVDLNTWLVLHQQRRYLMVGNPTSENLAREIWMKARELGIELSAVEIDETCTSCARYEP